MRFSTREQYGLRAMVELADRFGQGPVSLAEVARAQDISLPYLEQVIRRLRQAGLLLSSRGVHGGYVLARPPQAITIGEVLRVLEGSLIPIKCVSDEACSPCKREAYCATRTVWQLVRDRLVQALDNLTLADLCQPRGLDLPTKT